MSNIVIIGATSAIAMAMQRRLVDAESRFYLVARNEGHLNEVASDLQVRGAGATFTRVLDMSQMEQFDALLTDVVTKMAKLDIVIFAHGTLTDQTRAQAEPDYLIKELTINCLSTITLAGMFANILEKQQGGSLCVISSVAGDRGRKSNYIYGAAKACLSTFMQGLRNRLFPHVQVLTVKPGFVISPMTTGFKKGLLWVSPEVIAKDICRAIMRQQDVLYTPWFWRWIMLIIKHIPERIFKRLSL
jgi:decaprenylphospho-beta-D-erythro-pentofuranosid-2-ulose 2-reductase